MDLPASFAPGLYASGQPSPDDLARLAAEGVRTVINLRAPSEPVAFDEALETERLGLRYERIPIAGADDVTTDNVARFSRVLERARADGSVLIHCASGNRVGALVALDHGITRHGLRDDALVLGRAAGMTSLEPLVVRLLDRASVS